MQSPSRAPRRLIVNADDFGLTAGVNRAIAELYQAGALTSATLMASGPAFDDAVAVARAHPGLGIGCHVVLTDGVPVSRPAHIPTLLGDDRTSFRPSLHRFLAAAATGSVSTAEITREAVAQISRLQRAGIEVTHLDTHKHTHVLPTVAGALLAAAEQTGVRAIRNPFEATWSLRVGQTRTLRRISVALTRLFQRSFLAQPSIRNGRVITTRGTLGISATGDLNEPTLRALLSTLPSGDWELVCHPGYHDADLARATTRLRTERDIERDALLAVLPTRSFAPQQPRSHPSPFELIHYGSL